MHFPLLRLALRGQREARLYPGEPAGQQCGGIAADRRAMLESVSGAGTDEQDVVHLRVKIDQQIAVGAVLILAKSSFAERTARERGKTPDHESARSEERRVGEEGGRAW